MHTAEERQIVGVHAIRQYRRQNIIITHAVRGAGNKVVHTIRRCGMHNARTRVGGHIVAQINRRQAIVKRMVECDVIELVTRGFCDNFAGQTITLQAGFDQISR